MSDRANKTKPPQLLRLPLRADKALQRVLIVDGDAVFSPVEGLTSVIDFTDDGRGGWIGAAQVDSGKWGYLNGCGEWLIPPTLDNARGFTEDGLARYSEEGRWGFVNLAAQVVVAPQFLDARPFGAGAAGVLVGENDWRIIDASGRFTSDASFLNLFAFGANGLACALGRNKQGERRFGYVDRSGAWRIEPKFNTYANFGAHDVVAVSEASEQYGILNARGDWVLKPSFRWIESFNSDGLAYFNKDGNSWSDPPGYLDMQGRERFRGSDNLAKDMACGIVRNSYNGTRYLRADGSSLDTPSLSFGESFRSTGRFAVVRTSSYGGAEPQWGLLHEDGRFVPAPGDLSEPLTDADNWIVNGMADTPLVPFIALDGQQIAWMDPEGVVPYRAVFAQGQVTLTDANAKPLWHSSASDGECLPPTPFFGRVATDYFQHIASVDELLPLTERLLAQAELKLHALADGGADASASENDEDDDEEDDESDGDPDMADRIATTIKCRVMRCYVDEEHNGTYDFIGHEHSTLVEQVRKQFLALLSGDHGTADPDPEQAAPLLHGAQHLRGWPVRMKRALPGDTGALEESRELWLTLYASGDAGDGDVWSQLYVSVAPSVDALRTAQAARQASSTVHAGSGDDASKAEGKGDAVEAPLSPDNLPKTKDGWYFAVGLGQGYLSVAPPQWLDDEIVDHAVACHVSELEYAPVAFQTPERLEALIRRSARDAAEVPKACMTPQGLKLARSLYADDVDWSWTDERNSEMPSSWNMDALGQVWGGLLDHDKVMKAIKNYASLRDVPHWLRTDDVVKLALKTNVRNIEYVSPDLVTPALAEEAANNGDLIKHVPAHLLTPKMCLAAVSRDGQALQHVPEALRTQEVCVAALDDDSYAFPHVPKVLRVPVITRLIAADLSDTDDEGEPRDGSHWHIFRAWSHLWNGDHEAAIADALVGMEHTRFKQNAHYILASAYRALGRDAEIGPEASTVLSMESPYSAEWDPDEDTRWLHEWANKTTSVTDESALIAQMRTHPMSLANVPRERITDAIVDAALEADENAVRYVPRRLMTPERYVIALKKHEKTFEQIPPDMMSEDACVEEVRDAGYRLQYLPENLRTMRVCVTAVQDRESAIEYVPQEPPELRELVLKSVALLKEEDERNSGGALVALAPEQSTMSDRLFENFMNSSSRGGGKLAGWAFVLHAMFLGKTSNKPQTMSGAAGALEQRPGLLLLLNTLFGIIALICHVVVTVAVWRAEGIWYGLATAVLMGYSEIYWAWKYLFNTPLSVGLGICCIVVLLYTFAWKFFFRRVLKTFVR
ncbi:WG repeat-containing protein [Diaphorobacter sp. HDW4B]|uniref:WG repeat-containing protein n=1 Tax=Diaphorobacter sp. HDW4B TaxID=2714925 RepID=UPI00140E19AD|nr:WG repeat-containing protein [Diaphorobacter sp. HDW4B]QIL70027.1 WG repeat-containing protein [Diaphorobacter sp. HDW4B]